MRLWYLLERAVSHVGIPWFHAGYAAGKQNAHDQDLALDRWFPTCCASTVIYEKPYQAGDMVKVKAMDPPVYQLPDGLPNGATVKVLRKDVGYTDVEFEGKEYRVPMVLIDNGMVKTLDDETGTSPGPGSYKFGR